MATDYRGSMMTDFLTKEPTRQLCIDCRGKGFDLSPKGRRHSRRCQRCRGAGNIQVGNTKR